MRNLVGKSVGNIDNKNERETELLHEFNASEIGFASSEDGESEN